jgi:predicted nucleic acid-binding protein
MRLVVDTNIFVSAALKANSLPFLVLRWIDRHDGLLKSAATEAEFLDAIRKTINSSNWRSTAEQI